LVDRIRPSTARHAGRPAPNGDRGRWKDDRVEGLDDTLGRYVQSRTYGSSIMGRVGIGKKRLTAQAEYADGRKAESTIEVTLDRNPASKPMRRLSGSGLERLLSRGRVRTGPLRSSPGWAPRRRGIVLDGAAGLKPAMRPSWRPGDGALEHPGPQRMPVGHLPLQPVSD